MLLVKNVVKMIAVATTIVVADKAAIKMTTVAIMTTKIVVVISLRANQQQKYSQHLLLLVKTITAVIVTVRKVNTTKLQTVVVQADHCASMITVIKYVMPVIQTGIKKVAVAVKTNNLLHQYLHVNSMNYQNQ